VIPRRSQIGIAIGALRAGLLLALVVACHRDSSITRGADGANDWNRHLADAVPIGMSMDSARTVLTRNGFQCSLGADTVRSFRCQKDGGGRFEFARRRWIALLYIDPQNRVSSVRATTGMIGP
jgi:hypothetical protein